METTNFKTVEEIYSDIKENILNMDYYEVMTLHNEYCNISSYCDDIIFENDPFIINDYFPDSFKALKAMFYGEYNPNDEFFKFDGYGNLESFDNPSPHVDLTAIAEDILENERDYSFLDLDWEDDDEEEETDENGDGENEEDEEEDDEDENI